MQTINLNPQTSLMGILNSIQHCLISNDLGDICYPLTRFEQGYDDESSIKILTYGFNSHQEIDMDELAKTVAEYLPQEIQEPFIQGEHLILTRGSDTLAIHFNDSTITLILHNTGQW